MSGNQLTNVQRALLLPELKAKWPHFIANPHDIASSVTDILNRLNIPKAVSIKTIRSYGAEMGLPPIPVIRKPKTPAQLAALAKARAARHPTPQLQIMDYPPLPNYSETLERIANSLSDISLSLRNIYTTQSDQSMLLAKIHDALLPTPPQAPA